MRKKENRKRCNKKSKETKIAWHMNKRGGKSSAQQRKTLRNAEGACPFSEIRGQMVVPNKNNKCCSKNNKRPETLFKKDFRCFNKSINKISKHCQSERPLSESSQRKRNCGRRMSFLLIKINPVE